MDQWKEIGYFIFFIVTASPSHLPLLSFPYLLLMILWGGRPLKGLVFAPKAFFCTFLVAHTVEQTINILATPVSCDQTQPSTQFFFVTSTMAALMWMIVPKWCHCDSFRSFNEIFQRLTAAAGSVACIVGLVALLTSGLGFTICTNVQHWYYKEKCTEEKAETLISPPTVASKIYKPLQQQLALCSG